MSNIECWHIDGHINTCVFEKMKESAERFKAVMHYLVQKLAFHLKDQMVIHKGSMKICKGKKYKCGRGTGS